MSSSLSVNEDALERERKNCEALRRRLSSVEAQAAQGSSLEPAFAEAKNRLQQAEAEVARLQNALNKLKQQLQVNKLASVLSTSVKLSYLYHFVGHLCPRIFPT